MAMLHPFGKPLDIQTDLDGWSVVVPGGGIGLIEAIVLGAHLLIGTAFAVFGIGAFIAVLFQIETWDSHVPWLVGLTGLLGGGVVLIGRSFSVDARRRFARVARSTRLEVSGNDLRIERRVLGRLQGEPERVALAALGPVSFSGPFWESNLHLSPTLELPAFVKKEHQEMLKEVFDDCIEQAQTNPDQIPAPPEGLKRLIASRQ